MSECAVCRGCGTVHDTELVGEVQEQSGPVSACPECYPEYDECPGCGWGMEDGAFDTEDNPTFLEINYSRAPPDVQSYYYECYSAIWLITCSNCGTKWSAYYDNY